MMHVHRHKCSALESPVTSRRARLLCKMETPSRGVKVAMGLVVQPPYRPVVRSFRNAVKLTFVEEALLQRPGSCSCSARPGSCSARPGSATLSGVTPAPWFLCTARTATLSLEVQPRGAFWSPRPPGRQKITNYLVISKVQQEEI
ncbi:hypothetical protein NDU88_012604 [Pleurodeles waltl]|uniref:Uncharacterized protein n=1 Tax=Pleurodeles waltl TaxID=8319 RepID=A0AAV7R3Q6_PLEWA|nr:hypothetical protein NDU88_012604 [Pleurodeles waltl]